MHHASSELPRRSPTEPTDVPPAEPVLARESKKVPLPTWHKRRPHRRRRCRKRAPKSGKRGVQPVLAPSNEVQERDLLQEMVVVVERVHTEAGQRLTVVWKQLLVHCKSSIGDSRHSRMVARHNRPTQMRWRKAWEVRCGGGVQWHQVMRGSRVVRVANGEWSLLMVQRRGLTWRRP